MSYSADDIGDRTFSITQRGYDRGEVETFLREIARQLRTNANVAAGAQAEGILLKAKEQAAEIRSNADTYAASVRGEADTSPELLAVVERLERVANRIDPVGNSARSVSTIPTPSGESSNRTSEPVVAEAPSMAPPSTETVITQPAPEPAAEAQPASLPAPAPPISEPIAAAAEVTIPSAPPAEVLDDSLPVSEQLEEAKSLLDGVLDDVMGSLRPER